MEGASESTHCSICLPGWGGPDCSSKCGGEGALATYGPPGRSTDTDPRCINCTKQKTGYNFEWNRQNDVYASAAVSRIGANASMDCVAKWSQLLDGAW
jgi:hypothetical protein